MPMTYGSRLCGSEKNLKDNMIFTDLTANDRRDIIDYVSDKTGLSRAVIEKDWWVTTVLRAIFSLPYSVNISFKGGTNLSKCWGLIQRMSETLILLSAGNFSVSPATCPRIRLATSCGEHPAHL